MNIYNVVVMVVVVALIWVPTYADPAVSCVSNVDCISQGAEWCDGVHDCHNGNCVRRPNWPCDDGTEICNEEPRVCRPRKCWFHKACPSGYCDRYHMRCVTRPVSMDPDTARINGGQVFSTNGSIWDNPGWVTFLFVLVAAFVLAFIFALLGWVCLFL